MVCKRERGGGKRERETLLGNNVVRMGGLAFSVDRTEERLQVSTAVAIYMRRDAVGSGLYFFIILIDGSEMYKIYMQITMAHFALCSDVVKSLTLCEYRSWQSMIAVTALLPQNLAASTVGGRGRFAGPTGMMR